ncbi:hypothetical protein BHE74_00036605, partial [Ensete ventricosum]
ERLWDRAGVGVGEAGRASATRGGGASTSGGIPRFGAVGDFVCGGAAGGAGWGAIECTSWGRYGIMVCTILASAWTWLVRPRKASVVTISGSGFDAGEGNPGSVIILQKRLGVGMAVATSSVGRGWSSSVWRSVPESMNGRSGDMDPPSNAKNISGESGACLVDAFSLRVC